MALSQARKARREKADPKAIRCADPDHARNGGLFALQARLDGEHLTFDALEGLEKSASGFCEFATMSTTSEQLRTERSLERSHPARQRRLIDAQAA